jgi:hypothetical protein
MKSIFVHGLTFCVAMSLSSVAVYADRGGGSIRAAARPAPPPRAPERPPARAPEHAEVPHPAPPDFHGPPPRPASAPRPDWDDRDDDGGHFGGYGRGVPVHFFRGQRIPMLPPAYVSITFNSQPYFYGDDGAYYQAQSDGQYLVVQPPVGAVVPSLPPGAAEIAVGPTTYFYLDGVFYVAQDSSFAVVNPPPGIVVPALPSDATQVVINGSVAFQSNGFNYTPSIQDGVTVYTVTPM